MRPLTGVGILLILLGLVGFATGGLLFQHRHTDISNSTVQVSHERRSLLPLGPWISTVALVAGLGMVIAGRSR